MTDHVYEEHKQCSRLHCPICDGGLAVCTICGCLEGSLASECPGFNCYASHGDRIYNGEVDFRGGEWVDGESMHCPSWRREPETD